jgi:hypothetical protein
VESLKRNTKWGECANLNFDKLDSLGELASNYLGKHTPNASDFAAVLDRLDSVHAIFEIEHKKRQSVDINVASQKKIRTSTHSLNNSDMSDAASEHHIEQKEDVQSLDISIAKFIHVLRVAYKDADYNMLTYLQTYLHVDSYTHCN